MRLLIFGDSITQGMHDPEGGWADRLKRILLANGNHSVFNLGISGDKTEHVLARFGAEVSARTKRWDAKSNTVVVFAVGTNDSHLSNPGEKIVVSDEQFATNIRLLTDAAQQVAAKIIWMPILPVDESLTAPCTHDPVSFYNYRIAEFNKLIQQACGGDVLFADYDTEPVRQDLPDGLHPGPVAHAYIAEQCHRVVKGLVTPVETL